MKSYVVSTCHAFVCVVSVSCFFASHTVDLAQINRLAGGGLYGTGDELMIYSICYSFGYFLYDFLLILCCPSVRTGSALLHHVIVLLGLTSGELLSGVRRDVSLLVLSSVGLWYRICHPCHFYLLAEELSTIPLNLKSLYRGRHRVHHAFSILFVISFFVVRIVYGSIVCAYGFRAAPQFIRLAASIGDWTSIVVGLFQALLSLLTRLLNFYWAWLILQKCFNWQPTSKKPSLVNEPYSSKKLL